MADAHTHTPDRIWFGKQAISLFVIFLHRRMRWFDADRSDMYADMPLTVMDLISIQMRQFSCGSCMPGETTHVSRASVYIMNMLGRSL